MTIDPHQQDKIYQAVGEEIERNEYFPGPMARAVAESNDNKDLVHGLYIKFRVEELADQMETACAAKQCRAAARQSQAAAERAKRRTTLKSLFSSGTPIYIKWLSIVLLLAMALPCLFGFIKATWNRFSP